MSGTILLESKNNLCRPVLIFSRVYKFETNGSTRNIQIEVLLYFLHLPLSSHAFFSNFQNTKNSFVIQYANTICSKLKCLKNMNQCTSGNLSQIQDFLLNLNRNSFDILRKTLKDNQLDFQKSVNNTFVYTPPLLQSSVLFGKSVFT